MAFLDNINKKAVKKIVPLIIAGAALGYAISTNGHIGELEDILGRKKSDLGTFISLSTQVPGKGDLAAAAQGDRVQEGLDPEGLKTVSSIQKAASEMGLGDSVAGIRQLRDGNSVRYKASFDTVDVNALLNLLQNLEKSSGISTVSVDLGKASAGQGLRAEVTLQPR